MLGALEMLHLEDLGGKHGLGLVHQLEEQLQAVVADHDS
jgi:hypothetical protein